MSADAWILWLFFLGTALEVSGAVLTIREVQRRLAAVRAMQAAGVVIRVSAHDTAGTSDGAAVLSGGSAPSLEDRVASLEARLADVPRQIREAEARGRAHTERVTRQGLEDVQHNVMQYVDRLREAFTKTSDGGWWSYLGISLILIGFLIQSTSNLIGLLSG